MKMTSNIPINVLPSAHQSVTNGIPIRTSANISASQPSHFQFIMLPQNQIISSQSGNHSTSSLPRILAAPAPATVRSSVVKVFSLANTPNGGSQGPSSGSSGHVYSPVGQITSTTQFRLPNGMKKVFIMC